eukprot:4972953-Pyramimonas_sp.AAC.1
MACWPGLTTLPIIVSSPLVPSTTPLFSIRKECRMPIAAVSSMLATRTGGKCGEKPRRVRRGEYPSTDPPLAGDLRAGEAPSPRGQVSRSEGVAQRRLRM